MPRYSNLVDDRQHYRNHGDRGMLPIWLPSGSPLHTSLPYRRWEALFSKPVGVDYSRLAVDYSRQSFYYSSRQCPRNVVICTCKCYCHVYRCFGMVILLLFRLVLKCTCSLRCRHRRFT